MMKNIKHKFIFKTKSNVNQKHVSPQTLQAIHDFYTRPKIDYAMSKLFERDDPNGIIQYEFYKHGIYNTQQVMRLLARHMKSHKGHQLINFEQREYIDLHNFPSKWVVIYNTRLTDGSKAIGCIDAPLDVLQNFINDVKSHLAQHKTMENAVDVDNRLAIREVKHALKKQGKQITKNNVIRMLQKPFKSTNVNTANITVPF